MDTSCESIEDLLPLHADGELAADEALLVHAHLAGCAACRAEAERWQALNGLLDHGLGAPEPATAAEVEAVLQRLRRETPVWQNAHLSARLGRAWMAATALAAGLVLLVLSLRGVPLGIGQAQNAVIDQAADLAEEPRDVARTLPGELVGLYAEARATPVRVALEATQRWDATLGLTDALSRRTGIGPLVALGLLLLIANLLVARGLRTPRGALQRG